MARNAKKGHYSIQYCRRPLLWMSFDFRRGIECQLKESESLQLCLDIYLSLHGRYIERKRRREVALFDSDQCYTQTGYQSINQSIQGPLTWLIGCFEAFGLNWLIDRLESSDWLKLDCIAVQIYIKIRPKSTLLAEALLAIILCSNWTPISTY